MTPPQVHSNVEVSFSAGMFSTRTEGEPGVHGAGVTGTHGIGVNTPRAAAVAAATTGFETVVHMLKGAILLMGMLSMMFAPAGTGPTKVR